MLEKWMATRYKLSLCIIRLGIGVIFFFHGAQKLLGWYGGPGMEATTEMFQQIGIFYPSMTAWLVSLIEFLGGIALLIGLFTREFSLLLALVMVGAIYTVTWKNGFSILNNGFEYNVVLLCGCMSLFYSGAGSFSMDLILFPKERWRFVDPSQVKLEPPTDTLL